jgi:hypothetical protein
MIRRIACAVFALLYAVIGFSIFAGQASASTNAPLSSLAAGDTVQFAGYTWIILDPSTGYLLMANALTSMPFNSIIAGQSGSGKVFTTQDGNIGYYLNVNFYDKLPYADSSVIEPHSWTTGDENSDTNSSTSKYCSIGLISYSEFEAYKSINGVVNSSFWWMRTPYSGAPYGVFLVPTANDSNLAPGLDAGYANSDGSDGDYNVRPAIYLSPQIDVSGGNGGTVIVVNSDDVYATENISNGCEVSGSGTYAPGSSVTVKATDLNEGYGGLNFIGWTNDNGTVVSTSPTYSFTAPTYGDDSVQSTLIIPLEANFEPVPTITVVNGEQFTIVISQPSNGLTGTYNGSYGTLTALGMPGGLILEGTLKNISTVTDLFGAPTVVEIPIGNGEISVIAVNSASTTLDSSGSFY